MDSLPKKLLTELLMNKLQHVRQENILEKNHGITKGIFKRDI